MYDVDQTGYIISGKKVSGRHNPGHFVGAFPKKASGILIAYRQREWNQNLLKGRFPFGFVFLIFQISHLGGLFIIETRLWSIFFCYEYYVFINQLSNHRMNHSIYSFNNIYHFKNCSTGRCTLCIEGTHTIFCCCRSPEKQLVHSTCTQATFRHRAADILTYLR